VVVRIVGCTRHADHQPCWLTVEEGLCGREERVEEEDGDLVYRKNLFNAGVCASEDTVRGGVRRGGVLDDRSRRDSGWCLGQL
jgi:hypothetical protein